MNYVTLGGAVRGRGSLGREDGVAAASRMRRRVAAADGRVQRGERSREAIVEALFELIGEGAIQPTVQQVAERAGVGLRSVFRHFSDSERLYAEMDARLSAEAIPLLLEDPPEGSLRRRASVLVERRTALFERIAPYKRAGTVQRSRSPFLHSRHRSFVRALRRQLLRWLPELERAPWEIVESLDLATAFETWDRLRTEQRLSRDRAHATVDRTVQALLASVGE